MEIKATYMRFQETLEKNPEILRIKMKNYQAWRFSGSLFAYK